MSTDNLGFITQKPPVLVDYEPIEESGSGSSSYLLPIAVIIAAIVCALGRGADLRLSADYGQKAAKIALESPAAVSESLTLAALEE